MRYPPKIDASKLIFDQFHPLDHTPFNDRCRSFYPTGRAAGWHHIKLAWDFKWSSELHAKTLCRIGRHNMSTVFLPRDQVMYASCRHCWKRLGPNQPMDQIE